jgi:RNA polymerase sigma-70 factor (ECF subfamily)
MADSRTDEAHAAPGILAAQDHAAASDIDEDRTFFRNAVERVLDRLYGAAFQLTRNPASAEDLVSETVMKAWSALPDLRDRRCFPKWVLKILSNTFVSSARSHKAEGLVTNYEEDDAHFSLFEQLHQPFLLW